VLVEELHKHIYLKSPFAQQQNASEHEMIELARLRRNRAESEGPAYGVRTACNCVTGNKNNIFTVDQSTSLLKITEEEVIVVFSRVFIFQLSEDLTTDPERNSPYYMRLLAESLHTLDRIPSALTSINNQIAIQLRNLIHETIAQVREA
jgi:hypothetical protein